MRLFSSVKRISDDPEMPEEVRELALECWLAHDLRKLKRLVEAMPDGTRRDELIGIIVDAFNAGE